MKHEHKEGIECDYCKYGFEEMEKREAEMLEKFGWFCHAVYDDPQTPFGANIHTHGLQEIFDHKDLQICFPLDMKIAHSIFTNIIEDIKFKKKQFISGVDYSGYLANDYNVRFIDAIECKRPVLRLLICDANGEYEGEYAKQFKI